MFIKVNGVNLYYEVHGTGMPLILIAGFTCDTLLWTPLLPQLSRHFKVLIFDNRGAGQSDSPDASFTIEDMAQDTLELIDRLQLQKPHLLGHSMGGCIAQTLAERHPDRISKLALCNSLIRLNSVSTWCQRFFLHLREDGTATERLSEGIMPWLFSQDFLSDPAKAEELIALQLKNPHPQSTIGFKRQLEALTAFDSSQWFHRIKSPTLVINGEEDILCPRDSLELARGIANAKLVNFPHVGHLPLVEQPALFSKVIIDFFSS